MFHIEFNRPITEEDHKREDEKYRELIRIQKEHIHTIADKVAAGELLDSIDAEWAVAILRGSANRMSDVRKRPRGHQAQLPGELAVFVAGDVVFRNKSKNSAIEHYAEIYDVSVESIKSALKKQGYDVIKVSMEKSLNNKK